MKETKTFVVSALQSFWEALEITDERDNLKHQLGRSSGSSDFQ